MKPTNNLRWIERTVEYTIPKMQVPLLQGGVHVVEEQHLAKKDTVLQQFWEYCDYSAYERKDTDSLGCVDGHYGIWRDIEIVKEGK